MSGASEKASSICKDGALEVYFGPGHHRSRYICELKELIHEIENGLLEGVELA